VPVAAAGLADVGAGDPHPPVLGGRVEHAPQQLAVLGLELGLIAQGEAGGSDPVGQRVADPLQLPEAGDPGRAARRGDPGVDRDPRKGLGDEATELALEPPDLPAQLSAGEALVAPHPKRNRRIKFEQIRHRPFECNPRSGASYVRNTGITRTGRRSGCGDGRGG